MKNSIAKTESRTYSFFRSWLKSIAISTIERCSVLKLQSTYTFIFENFYHLSVKNNNSPKDLFKYNIVRHYYLPALCTLLPCQTNGRIRLHGLQDTWRIQNIYVFNFFLQHFIWFPKYLVFWMTIS